MARTKTNTEQHKKYVEHQDAKDIQKKPTFVVFFGLYIYIFIYNRYTQENYSELHSYSKFYYVTGTFY